jgi:Calx-beta domain-containing protein
LLVMNEILTIAGPTPDPEFTADFPNAVREWCINTAAVDPSTNSVFANSEDGKLYRWDLTTNTLSQVVTLSSGVGEAYTPTVVGVDGTVYAINESMLNAVGQAPSPTLSINDVSVTEHNTGTTTAVFTVTLSPASTQTVTVAFTTANGTATVSDNDYKSIAGTLTFAAGTTTKTISVVVIGDKFNEPNETFFVNLSNPSNAAIADGQGQGTILNDDALPALAIRDISVHEGNSGTTNAVFTVKLSAASKQTVTAHFATADGTATAAGNDYTPASGTVTFAPLQISQTIAVPIIGDTVKEANETFFVNLTQPVNATISRSQGRCTIQNDDK